MIHAYALEPRLVAVWGSGAEYRFIQGNFGLGTPRVLLELPRFRSWRRDVLRAATELGLSDVKRKRVEEMLRIFDENRCRRHDASYDGERPWLENAEREYQRKPFKAILATANPREHEGVVASTSIDPGGTRWICPLGATPARTPDALRAVLEPMLANCSVLHLVDPHFGPENARHRKVLEALADALTDREITVHVHCTVKQEEPVSPPLSFFEEAAAALASRLPATVTVEFVRWKRKEGSDRLHNRYVLTDLGGVVLGTGLDSGRDGETDDVLLLPREQYMLRWRQYAMNDGTFEKVDTPKPIRGARHPRPARRGR